MLGDADHVARGLLGDDDVPVSRLAEVDVIGAHAGREDELEVRRVLHYLFGNVDGPERGGDQNLRVFEVLLELATLPVRGRDQLVPFALDPLPQPDLSVRAARYRLPFQLPELDLMIVAW